MSKTNQFAWAEDASYKTEDIQICSEHTDGFTLGELVNALATILKNNPRSKNCIVSLCDGMQITGIAKCIETEFDKNEILIQN